ncbi:MAG TPA: transposase [Firmicutes bacterium]|nr:transposase [Bacillota bacterium]
MLGYVNTNWHVKELYADIGRPSISPAQLTGAILIQLEKGLSDRELEEATLYNDRVKYALGMSRNGLGLEEKNWSNSWSGRTTARPRSRPLTGRTRTRGRPWCRAW